MVKEGDSEAQAAAAAASGVSEQGDHQEALQRRFHGRAKLLAEAVEKVREVQAKGGVLLVHGAAGEGKTVFMASGLRSICSASGPHLKGYNPY